MTSDTTWWYAKGDKRFGPHTASELKAIAASGQLLANDMVWKEGLEKWLQASSVTGLIPNGEATSSPAPAPGSSPVPPPSTKPEPRKKSRVPKIALWIGAIVVALIVRGAVVNREQGRNGAESQRVSAAPEPSPPTIKVGDSFTTPTFEIQIRSAQTRTSVGESPFLSQPAEGGIYIAIQWSYKNISRTPVNAFALPTLHLIAPDGTKYDRDLEASSSYATELDVDAKILSDLNPGIRVVDADVFEVSSQMFDPSWWRILVDADEPTEVAFVKQEQ
jgi:hypothetical protein